MQISTEPFVLGIFLGLVVGLVVGLIIPVNLLNVLSSYSTLKVEKDIQTENTYIMKGKDFFFGEKYYQISYTTDDEILVVGVFGNSSFYETFPAEQDSKFRVFGMEVVVSEVHSDYIIVLKKPL